MVYLDEIASLEGGTPQSRIAEAVGKKVPTYFFYGQSEIEDDLNGVDTVCESRRRIQTNDTVSTLNHGDLVFSLLSGRAAVVGPNHSGDLFTQNYVRLVPSNEVDAKYLAFILNESPDIRKQMLRAQQGSTTMRHTIAQLAELQLSNPPSKECQEVIGALYFNQLRLATLKKRLAGLETTKMIGRLKEACRHE